MQYILTQEEMDDRNAEMADLRDQLRGMPLKEHLQVMCTKIANDWPTYSWNGQEEPRPWGCVLTIRSDHYCDRCPVKEICPNEHKNWSK